MFIDCANFKYITALAELKAEKTPTEPSKTEKNRKKNLKKFCLLLKSPYFCMPLMTVEAAASETN